MAGKVFVMPTQPFEQHGGMLHLLAHVVEQYLAQHLVLGVVGALAIPVGGVELLLQRDDAVVKQARFLRQRLARYV